MIPIAWRSLRRHPRSCGGAFGLVTAAATVLVSYVYLQGALTRAGAPAPPGALGQAMGFAYMAAVTAVVIHRSLATSARARRATVDVRDGPGRREWTDHDLRRLWRAEALLLSLPAAAVGGLAGFGAASAVLHALAAAGTLTAPAEPTASPASLIAAGAVVVATGQFSGRGTTADARSR